jgi:outer membrane protein, heavy metal efflux system
MTTKYPFAGFVAAALWALIAVSANAAESLSLSQAVEMALGANPSVAAGRLSAEAARHAARGARALANPEISISPNIIGEAGSDSAVFVSQPLEINGSRRARGNAASHEAAAAGYDALTSRREIAFRVNQGYWDVVRAQELVKLNVQNIEYLQSLNAAVQRQLEVGTIPGSQLIKTEVELARARQESAKAHLELSQAKSALNSLLNRPTDTDFTATDPLTFQELTPDRTALLASALGNRPELSAAIAATAAAKSSISLARLQTAPDVAVQARKESFEAGAGAGIAVVVSLPVLDWGSVKADVRRAESEAMSREKQVEAVMNSVALDVELAVQQVNAASQVVREFQSGILDKSEELARMARVGYEKGATGYLEVLEAQRTLRSAKTDYYSALADQAKAIAQLEWATGTTEVKK